MSLLSMFEGMEMVNSEMKDDYKFPVGGTRIAVYALIIK